MVYVMFMCYYKKKALHFEAPSFVCVDELIIQDHCDECGDI